MLGRGPIGRAKVRVGGKERQPLIEEDVQAGLAAGRWQLLTSPIR